MLRFVTYLHYQLYRLNECFSVSVSIVVDQGKEKAVGLNPTAFSFP